MIKPVLDYFSLPSTRVKLVVVVFTIWVFWANLNNKLNNMVEAGEVAPLTQMIIDNQKNIEHNMDSIRELSTIEIDTRLARLEVKIDLLLDNFELAIK